MEQRRHQLFAGAGFAAHQHGHVAPGDALGVFHQPPPRRTLAHHGLPHCALQLVPPSGPAQRARLDRPRDDRAQLVDPERLGQIVVRASLDGSDRRLLGPARGQQHHGQVGLARANLPEQCQAIHAWHHQIGDHRVDAAVQTFQRFPTRPAGDRDDVRVSQGLLQREENRRLVVTQQDGRHGPLVAGEWSTWRKCPGQARW